MSLTEENIIQCKSGNLLLMYLINSLPENHTSVATYNQLANN